MNYDAPLKDLYTRIGTLEVALACVARSSLASIELGLWRWLPHESEHAAPNSNQYHGIRDSGGGSRHEGVHVAPILQ